MRKRIQSAVIIILPFLLVALVANGQPAPGFSKTAPLSGTGSSGAPLKLLPCALNEIYKWNGTAFVCAADGGGGGSISSVALAGPGADTTTCSTGACTLSLVPQLITVSATGTATASAQTTGFDITTSSIVVQGITAGVVGRMFILVNSSSGSITIANDNGSATAGNRIYTGTGADVTLPTKAQVLAIYATSDSHYHLGPIVYTAATYTATSPLALVGSAFGMANGTRGDITTTTGTNPGDTWTINSAAVTLAKMANLATATFIGRVTAGAGVPEAMTGTQATTLLDLATTSLKGLAPARSGTATTYLDGTGVYSTPTGTGDLEVVTTASGTQNDWNLSLTGSSIVVINSTTFLEPTGLTNGVSGRKVTFYNASATDHQFDSAAAGSTATNRFVLHGSNVLLKGSAGCALTVEYNANASRWVEVGYQCATYSGNYSISGSLTVPNSGITAAGAITGGAVATVGTTSGHGVYVGTNSDMYMETGIPASSSSANCGYSTNGVYTCWNDYAGYNAGTTQARIRKQGNGKGVAMQTWDGSTGITSIDSARYLNPSYAYYFHDDFETCPVVANSNVIGPQMAYTVTGTSGNIVMDNSIDTGHPVWCRMSTTGVDTAKINAGFGAAAGTGLTRFVGGGMSYVAEGVVKTGATLCDAVTNVCTFRWGFFDTNTSAFTTAIFLEFDPASSTGFWRIGACAPAFGCTRSTSSVAIAANTTYKLGINCTAAGSCSYTVNGTSAGTIATTNVPTGTSAGFSPGILFLKTAGSTQRDMYVDYFDFYSVITTPR